MLNPINILEFVYNIDHYLSQQFKWKTGRNNVDQNVLLCVAISGSSQSYQSWLLHFLLLFILTVNHKQERRYN